MSPSHLSLNEPAPTLSIPTFSGTNLNMSAQKPDKYTIIIFYRGWHCSVCMDYLREEEEGCTVAKKRGIDVIAIRMETTWRRGKVLIALRKAAKHSHFQLVMNCPNDSPQLGTLHFARPAWHFGIQKVLPEPALFVLKPDTTVHSGPKRPLCSTLKLLAGLDFVMANNYPSGTSTRRL